MKIALDFDGTLLTTEENAYFFNDWSRIILDQSLNFDIVSSRSSKFLSYMQSHIKSIFHNSSINIICKQNRLDKIKFLNSNHYDIIIDNELFILENCKNIPIKILYGEIDNSDLIRLVNSKFTNHIIYCKSFNELENLLTERKFFSPGPTPVNYDINITFSHRSDLFESLYSDCKKKIRDLINDDKDVIFTQGSGTSAIETVLSSCLNTYTRICLLNNGVFGERAVNISKYYSKKVIEVSAIEDIQKVIENNNIQILYLTLFETSKSIYNGGPELESIISYCNTHNILLIFDCISSFPYYSIPEGVDIIITSSAKQLQGLPSMGIVFYNKKIHNFLIDRGDYLNFKKYILYDQKNQTPHTSLIPQLISLNQSLLKRVWESRVNSIDENAKFLISNSILYDNQIGERIAPVLTFKVKNISEIKEFLDRFNTNVYINTSYMDNYIQISCFNYSNINYYKFLMSLLIFIEDKI